MSEFITNNNTKNMSISFYYDENSIISSNSLEINEYINLNKEHSHLDTMFSGLIANNEKIEFEIVIKNLPKEAADLIRHDFYYTSNEDNKYLKYIYKNSSEKLFNYQYNLSLQKSVLDDEKFLIKDKVADLKELISLFEAKKKFLESTYEILSTKICDDQSFIVNVSECEDILPQFDQSFNNLFLEDIEFSGLIETY